MTTIYLLIVNSFGRSATRRAFRYIFARLISPRSKKSVPESHSHSPYPNPVPNSRSRSRSQRMPLQSLTQRVKKDSFPVETRQCNMP